MTSTTKKPVKKTETVSKKDYDNLVKQLQEMQEKFNQILNTPQPVQSVPQYSGDRDISVTSLTVGLLNLSTDGYGAGEIYSFHQIGEEQMIPLEDLRKIIKNNKSFVEGGNIFINDDEVVRNQRLTSAYKKILSYEEMKDLFNKDRKAFEKIFANMTKNQKETLKRIVFEKLNQDEKSVDMNIVQVLNDDMNIDIMDDFRNQQKMAEILKNDN